MKPRTVQVFDNEWVRPVMNKALEQCCRCGLKHEVTYRVRDAKTNGIFGGYYIEYRAKRLDSKQKK